jgi:predicted transcriptional regulator
MDRAKGISTLRESRVRFGSTRDFDRILSDLVQVLIVETVADEMPGGVFAGPEDDVLAD